MNRVRVKVEGLRELDKALRMLPAEIKTGGLIMRALRAGARLVAAEARRRAPVANPSSEAVLSGRRKSGALRAGITTQFSRREELTVEMRVRNRGYIFAEAGKRASSAAEGNPNYWWLVEFGTSKMPAQPFMRPAFESKKQAALAEIIRHLKAEIIDVAIGVARKAGVRP